MNPYTDDYMKFDESNNHYILTEKDISEYLGTDSLSELNNPNAVEAFLRRISDIVYDFLHSHTFYNQEWQDYLIATTESGRSIIKRAMEEQYFYIRKVGDLSVSTKENRDKNMIAPRVKTILQGNIKEYNCNLLSIAIC